MEPSLYEVCIPTAATIRRAMEAIDDAGSEIALLVDGDDRLIGVLTDGDIRRALLGAVLADAALDHASRDFVATESFDRAAALEFMQARDLAELPVVDRHGLVVGLHRLRSILGVTPRHGGARRGPGRAPRHADPPRSRSRWSGSPVARSWSESCSTWSAQKSRISTGGQLPRRADRGAFW